MKCDSSGLKSVRNKENISKMNEKDYRKRRKKRQINFSITQPKSKRQMKQFQAIEDHAEIFRMDFITQMKIPDYAPPPSDYMILEDSWKPEWEKAVQVPSKPADSQAPLLRPYNGPKVPSFKYKISKRLIRDDPSEQLFVENETCDYDLDGQDQNWLELVNEHLTLSALPIINELTMERIVEACEVACQRRCNQLVSTEEGLGIEYDANVVCDVCRSPDCDECNEILFCDRCNIGVHQACYGIQVVPEGDWLCRTCYLGVHPPCILCPVEGGAMKSNRRGSSWCHVSCALWIPETAFGDSDRMEPVINISQIPDSRWNLICVICREKVGACIQCSVKNCTIPFHITCAFSQNLECCANSEDGSDEILFRAFCSKHTKSRAERRKLNALLNKNNQPFVTCENVFEKMNNINDEDCDHEENAYDSNFTLFPTDSREYQLTLLNHKFFSLVDPYTISQNLQLNFIHVSLVYEYWKLKRASNYHKPLMQVKPDSLLIKSESINRQDDTLAQRARMYIQLRQDMEQVRNLCYMVISREKRARALMRTVENIFEHQCDLAEQCNNDSWILTAHEVRISKKTLIEDRMDSTLKTNVQNPKRQNKTNEKTELSEPIAHVDNEISFKTPDRNSEDFQNGDSPNPLKRKRGRPRKLKTEFSDPPLQTLNIETCSNDINVKDNFVLNNNEALFEKCNELSNNEKCLTNEDYTSAESFAFDSESQCEEIKQNLFSAIDVKCMLSNDVGHSLSNSKPNISQNGCVNVIDISNNHSALLNFRSNGLLQSKNENKIRKIARKSLNNVTFLQLKTLNSVQKHIPVESNNTVNDQIKIELVNDRVQECHSNHSEDEKLVPSKPTFSKLKSFKIPKMTEKPLETINLKWKSNQYEPLGTETLENNHKSADFESSSSGRRSTRLQTSSWCR